MHHVSIRAAIFALVPTFCLGILAAPAAGRPCEFSNYSVEGRWWLRQSNGMIVQLDLEVRGSANFDKKGNPIGGIAYHSDGQHSGMVTGHLNLDKLDFQIAWKGKTGVYTAKIDGNGNVTGTTYDKDVPTSTATWRSTAPLRDCVELRTTTVLPPEPVRTPPQTKATPPPAAPKPSAPPPSAKAPFITANPAFVSVPANQNSGTTTLTWDAGKDHPYAEVWVKDENGKETFVVEQGKGSRQVTVHRGRTYIYILTDAGQRLGLFVVRGTQ